MVLCSRFPTAKDLIVFLEETKDEDAAQKELANIQVTRCSGTRKLNNALASRYIFASQETIIVVFKLRFLISGYDNCLALMLSQPPGLLKTYNSTLIIKGKDKQHNFFT